MIFIDFREPERIVEKLKSLGLDVYVKRLELGDYLVKHSVYEVPVERKDVNDFINSIIDGRLFRQCHFISARYPLSILAVVGDLEKALENRNISRGAVIGAIVSIAIKNVQGQVVPLAFKNEEDFCLALKSIDARVSEGDLKILPRLKAMRIQKLPC